MNGTQALAAFNLAAQAVKNARYLDAILIDMQPSDILVIVSRIKEHVAAGAKEKANE